MGLSTETGFTGWVSRSAGVGMVAVLFWSTGLFVPNFPQPQPCWPLSTQGPQAALLDGESPWWCCGISLRYAWRRHLVRTASAAPMAQQARAAHRERGSRGAGRGPASLEATTARRIRTTPWTLCGFSSRGYQELGAWGPCGCLVLSACHPVQQVTGVEPRTSRLQTHG